MTSLCPAYVQLMSEVGHKLHIFGTFLGYEEFIYMQDC